LGTPSSKAKTTSTISATKTNYSISVLSSEEIDNNKIELYRIAAHAGDLVKIRDKTVKWDMNITETRRTLIWEKQISLVINPEEAERIHSRREGQIEGNNVPCTMCGAACVYIMLPQQRKEKHDKVMTTKNNSNEEYEEVAR